MSDVTTDSITLDQQKRVSDIYSRYGHHDSAHSFESVFMWKTDMKLSIYLDEEIYAINSLSDDITTWFFPVGSEGAKSSFISSLIEKEENFRFRYMTLEDVKFITENFAEKFRIVPASTDSEYIYMREVLVDLPGHHFVKDRGRIRKLTAEHELEVMDIYDAKLDDIYEISSEWDQNKKEYTEVIDHTATDTLIGNYHQLGVRGILLKMDGRPCGVIAGFKLDDNNIDCCLQKTSHNIQGLSCYLRREFVKAVPDEIQFFNWEEDLGIEGLRQAKERMLPDHMISMYTGYIK